MILSSELGIKSNNYVVTIIDVHHIQNIYLQIKH